MKWFRNSKKVEEKYKKENLSEQKKQPNDDIKKENLVSITEKFELVKKEYNASVGDLMLSKKELKKIKDDIKKSNKEYDNIVSKIKLGRTDLLKINNEFKEKNEYAKKISSEYEKQSLVIQEINNSKRELSEIKNEISKCNKELELVKMKTDISPELKSLKEEKKKLEYEIAQKRKDVESGAKELKFIQNETSEISKRQKSTRIVDAASAVVASMNQKLQITLKELDAVKNALENEKQKTRNVDQKDR
mgnify:CR=1 FL=1